MIFDELQLVDVFAMMAPEPTKDDVMRELEKDRMANPHNDTYRPKRRTEREIVAELKYWYANAMIKARKTFIS